MLLVPLSEIEVRKRQRSAMDRAKLNELKESIASTVLMHPPVCWFDNNTETWVLTAGERRLTAVRELHAENRQFRYDGKTIEAGWIPISRLEESIAEVTRFEIELDENIRRDDLSWQDRTQAYADLHKMRQQQNPQQTNTDTARELVERGAEKSINRARINVASSVVVAQHLDNEKIAKARNENEALSLIYKMTEEKAMAALINRRLVAAPKEAEITIRQGDCLTILPGLDSDIADIIIADPPYGIGADAGGFRSRTVHHHNYKDTGDNARKIAQAILLEGFRICKSRANIFLFCDIDLFPWLKTTAQNTGWTPFRRPLVWQKSASEGLAPWGSKGPRITTEFIFYATKGQRGLNASPIDVFDDKRVSRAARIHAAEKPVDLLKKLIQCSTLPSDFVLDPCCGSGSTLVAAKELKRTGLGIELDPDYYSTAVSNVFGGDLDGTTAQSSDR